MSHEESSVKLGSGGSFKNSSIHFDSMEDGQISSDFSELPVDPKETINNINLLSNKNTRPSSRTQMPKFITRLNNKRLEINKC